MKKKWIIVVIIVLILIINPSKSNTFNKRDMNNKKFEELNKIELQNEASYIKYKDNIVLAQNNELIVIDSNGEDKTLLKLSKSIENFEIDSNEYIDIIDKKENKTTSINSNGKTIFTDKVYRETLMYKSISKNTFISTYKNENKEYVRIQDIDNELIKEIEYDSKITHIEGIDNRFVVVDLKTDKGIYSAITIYDTNGNLIKRSEFNDIILDVVCNNDNIYVVFENKIEVLENELVKKYDINIEAIKEVHISENGEIFIINESNQIKYISNDKEESIKLKPEVESIELLEDSYITYSKSSIYDKENKEIVNLDDDIVDVININEDTIGIYTGGLMKILKLK